MRLFLPSSGAETGLNLRRGPEYHHHRPRDQSQVEDVPRPAGGGATPRADLVDAGQQRQLCRLGKTCAGYNLLFTGYTPRFFSHGVEQRSLIVADVSHSTGMFYD